MTVNKGHVSVLLSQFILWNSLHYQQKQNKKDNVPIWRNEEHDDCLDTTLVVPCGLPGALLAAGRQYQRNFPGHRGTMVLS
jgi:hypothetical protein